MYLMLKDFHNRHEFVLRADAIAGKISERCRQEIKQGLVTVFGAPPVEGLGTASGFKIMIEDRGNLGPGKLQEMADQIVTEGNRPQEENLPPRLSGLFTSFRSDTPWMFLDTDRTKTKSMGVPMGNVFNALEVFLGSLYVNDFNRFGRTWQVNVQADSGFRQDVGDLQLLQVSNMEGQMVPLATLSKVKEITGPVMLTRYNIYPAAAINGSPAPGVSSGEAIEQMEKLALKLPPAIQYEWTELTFLQIQAGNIAMYVFAGAVVLVFLVLAAQYESWSLPLAVILVVPMCLLCSVLGMMLARMDINIFTQIGFIVLVGLASKNAILIVEFAKASCEKGLNRFEATLAACQLRLRPIMMTSFAFILGVVPLVLAEGAGAEMRQTLGTAVFSGMLGVTLFGIFLTPVFFYVIQGLTGRREKPTDSRPWA